MEQHYDNYWYELESGDTLRDRLVSEIHSIEQDHVTELDMAFRHLVLYDPMMTVGTLGQGVYSLSDRLPKNRPTWNITQAIVNTIVSHIASREFSITCLADGGTYKTRQSAENLSYFLNGFRMREFVHAETRKAFRDACWYGTGYIRIGIEGNDVVARRIWPTDVRVGRMDGRDGHPRDLHITETMERKDAIARYPEHRDIIEDAGLIETRNLLRTAARDPVTLCWSWHRGEGGRYLFWCDAGFMEDEDFTDKDFPVIPIKWLERARGYEGQGIPEIVASAQREMNQLLQKIYRHLKLASSHVFVRRGSQINPRQLNNKEFGLIEYVGQPPVMQTVQAIAPEYYQQAETLYRRGFELCGLSELVAFSQKPPGIEAAKALRELKDTQSQRFQEIGQQWQEFHTKIAQAAIREFGRLAEQGETPSMESRTKYGDIRKIDWKQAVLDENNFKIETHVSGFTKETVAGRTQEAMELVQLDPRFNQVALDLVQHPDIKGYVDRFSAPRRLVDKIINDILLDKAAPEPDDWMDLEYAIGAFQLAINEAMVNDEDDSKIDALIRWRQNAQEFVARNSMPSAPPPNVPPPSGPPGPQAAPPMGQAMPLPGPGGM